MVGNSHSKSLAKGRLSRLGDNYAVERVVKPSATLKQVVPDSNKCSDSEYLIITGGSNDIDKGL